ncbi:MAG TPA: phage tail protein [Sphingomonas sp.]|jgi:hypothetical protein|uniref:phage tail protein n=1 Tax=Sphingomonas sp. TaxID=28214 RepID=UPI002ED877B6
MATLVLTTVGTLVGGPVGGAIGALIGNRIDARVLASGRQGPRLGDLSVQTSTYGSAIPKLFGTMRVAGTVIWATDLKETGTRGGGGKGQPRTTTYSYSASFAVAVSARRVRSIGRIWADGILLRGAAGDWKAATGFRFHDGGEDQAPDPLIAAAEGIGQTPAYRGIAYVVFEDMSLAAYGNRIPSLSFEVEADAAAATVGAIAREVSGGVLADATATTIVGYAASGDSVRAAIETLAAVVPLTLVDGDHGLVLREGEGAAVRFPDHALGAAAGERGGVRRTQARRAAGTVPDAVTLAYYDVARTYQTGLQHARRGGVGRRVAMLELPAVLSADLAKNLAERRLAADVAAGRTAVIRLPWRWMAVRPGQAVTLSDGAEPWRVASVTLDRMVVELQLVGSDGAGSRPLPTAVAGRAITETDEPQGPTTIALFEMPPGPDAADGSVRLCIAAAGTPPGWRQARLDGSADAGGTLTPIGRTAPPATMGRVSGSVPAAGGMMFDDRTEIEILLLNDRMTVQGCSDAQLLAGANLAWLGAELVQFGRAEQIGVARFRIGRLLRGRRGTEVAIAQHGPDERFILIDPDRMVSVAADVGSVATVLAQGIGDPAPVVATHEMAGLAVRPLSPVHLRAARTADGAVRISWTRRSRMGWGWADGVDAPLGEETERYRLRILRPGGARTVDLTVPEWRYPPALQAADGYDAAGMLRVSVVQVGTAAASIAAEAEVRV